MVDSERAWQLTEALGEDALTRIETTLKAAEQHRKNCESSGRGIAARVAELRQAIEADIARGRAVEVSWAGKLSVGQAFERAVQGALSRRIWRMRIALNFYLYRWKALKATVAIAVLILIYVFWPDLERATAFVRDGVLNAVGTQ
jgi:hypothetical protein